MTELQQIIDASGVKPSTCSCKACQSMCLNAPCIGTPDDIIKLVAEGYIGKLERVIWSAGKRWGIPEIHMVQIDFNDHKGCPLFKDGLCTIHHIKPTDGKLATCKPYQYKLYPSAGYVALTWLMPKHKAKIEFLDAAVLIYKAIKDDQAPARMAQTLFL